MKRYDIQDAAGLFAAQAHLYGTADEAVEGFRDVTAALAARR